AQKRIAEAEKLKQEADALAESRKREALVEAKDEAYRLRAEIERENREKRAEIQRLERRLAQKEESLERRLESVDKKERAFQYREVEVEEKNKEIQEIATKQRDELQRISGMTVEEARSSFLKTIEEESRHEAAKLIREIEEEAKRDGERRARNIITGAIQR